MAEIMKIMGVALITALTSALLRETKRELSFAVGVAGAIVILLFLTDSLRNTLSIFTMIAEFTGVENGLFKTMLKIVGISYVTEFGVGILQDFGSDSVADKVALGGKITIISLSLPIVERFFGLVRGFLELL